MKPSLSEKKQYVISHLHNPEQLILIEPMTEYMIDHTYYMLLNFEKSDIVDYTVKISNFYKCIVFSVDIYTHIHLSNLDYCVYIDCVKVMWCNGFSDYLVQKKYYNKQFINLVRLVNNNPQLSTEYILSI